MRAFLGLSLLLTGTASPALGQAEALPYRGPHPLDLDGHWHEEGAVHVHATLPVGLGPFARIDGVMVFLADPVAYGWDGDVFTYLGVHPLPPRIGEYCGIDGEHRHWFAPEGEFRRDAEGRHRFAGALRGGVPMHRPGRAEPERPVPAPAVGPPAPVYAYPVGWVAPGGGRGPCELVRRRTPDGAVLVGTGFGCPLPPAGLRVHGARPRGEWHGRPSWRDATRPAPPPAPAPAPTAAPARRRPANRAGMIPYTPAPPAPPRPPI